ncbi:GIY-YIG nuclease family protein [Curtobacterium sp. MCBD17_034]|uniref:GIY-YIG nuclease family protein n=1 Tax=unclassified Curtobacterium TaxID=257496 RepID=UPI0035C96351
MTNDDEIDDRGHGTAARRSRGTRAAACAGPVCGSSCRRPVPPDAPVALCAQHLAVAAEWAGATGGVDDVLPAPCASCGARTGVRYPSGWVCGVCEWRLGAVPDGEARPPRVDVVYYIRFEERIKIGTSANPRQRLARLWHEELLGFERGGRALERARHHQFAHLRYPGSEWFRIEDDLRQHVGRVTDGQPAPWDLYTRWVSEAVALRT